MKTPDCFDATPAAGVRYVAQKFGISGEYIDTEDDFGELPDMGVFDKYARIKVLPEDQKRIDLKTYILLNLQYFYSFV